jgi:sec-independent protein translocase protein TatA
MSVGPLEIGVVLLVVLLIFGPKRLPELGRSLGRGMREFKDSITGKDDEAEAAKLEQKSPEASPNVAAAAPAGEEPAATAAPAKPADAS